MIGIVKEVFIPKEYKYGIELDVMYSNKIGFIVLVDNIEIEIIQEQNLDNCKIHREDKVIINKIGNNNYDIELYSEV